MSQYEKMISYEEAASFLENILEFPKAWKTTFDNDKIEFLRFYMKQHATRVPFQNVTMAIVDPEKRRRPTEEELIAQGLSGIGGCCLNLNFFTKIVLQALGLNAFAVQGTHYLAPVEGTHCMCMVKLNEDEMYMVEVGAGYPFLDVIPMQNLPFQFTAGGYVNEFRQMADGKIGRFQIGGGLYGGSYVEKTESLRTSWNLTPKNYEDFSYAMDKTFTSVPDSSLLKTNYFCRYFFPGEYKKLYVDSDASVDISDSTRTDTPTDYVFIFKRRIVIGDKYCRKSVRQFDSYIEMVKEIEKCFPKLKLKDIQKALDIFSTIEIKPSPYDTIL
ncbi:hypothetical protein Bhyg_13286 [Pseudolycoriella hygida]|uniref:arylamine N-acetyltransferase n=1 Tax=Pseudolycoriella hygida TaxID=35572 RepID=A0A9Q0MPU8_9DIPT|nr:hypothetical protein Bhyg_13286 [Pseudolycoriella hygida]